VYLFENLCAKPYTDKIRTEKVMAVMDGKVHAGQLRHILMGTSRPLHVFPLEQTGAYMVISDLHTLSVHGLYIRSDA
jgi:hypothetical protein